MRGLLIFIGTTIFSSIGWWVSETLGFGLMACFLLSSLLGLVGIYAGWKFHHDQFE